MSRHYQFVMKKTIFTEAQIDTLTRALKEYEEAEMDHGSPVDAEVALTVRRKFKKNLSPLIWNPS
jgi:hypothetical protein